MLKLTNRLFAQIQMLFNVLFRYVCNENHDAFCLYYCQNIMHKLTNRLFAQSKDFKYLAECYKPPSVVPAVLKVTDIAGLIKGASEGAGLGNAFLSHIAAVDGIYHLVRAFEDDEVIHVDDSIDPIRDLETIQGELCLKDKSTLEIVLEREHERVRKEKNLSRSATNYTLSEVFTSAFDKVCSCWYNYKQEVGKKMSFCIKLLLNLTNAVPYNICVYIYIGNEIG